MEKRKKMINDLKVGEPLIKYTFLEVKMLKKTNLRHFENNSDKNEDSYRFNALFTDEEGSTTLRVYVSNIPNTTNLKED